MDDDQLVAVADAEGDLSPLSRIAMVLDAVANALDDANLWPTNVCGHCVRDEIEQIRDAGIAQIRRAVEEDDVAVAP